MPGTLMLGAYDMSLADALSVLQVRDSMMFVTPDEFDELRRAACAIVEAHAAEVVATIRLMGETCGCELYLHCDGWRQLAALQPSMPSP